MATSTAFTSAGLADEVGRLAAEAATRELAHIDRADLDQAISEGRQWSVRVELSPELVRDALDA